MLWAAPSLAAHVALRWKAVAGADRYELQIARDPEFRAVAVQTTVVEPRYRWNELPSEDVYWRVRSIDADGRHGEWSPPQRLSLTAAAPAPLSPSPGADLPLSGAPIELRAEGSKVLREYVFELSPHPQFTSGVQVQRTAAPSARFALSSAGVFHWRVKGVDLSGRETPASAPRSFRVQNPARAQRTSTGRTGGAVANGPPGSVQKKPEEAGATCAPGATCAVAAEAPAELPAEPPSPSYALSLGARLGWTSNFGGISAPTLAAELTVATGLLERRVWGSVRAGFHRAATEVPTSVGLPEALPARAAIVPVSALALYVLPLAPVTLYGGGGPTVQVVQLEVGGASELRPAIGAQVLLGASRGVGPGELSLEAAQGFGQLEGALGRLRTGGLAVSVGYRVAL